MMSNKSSNDSTPTRYTTSSIPTTSSVKDPTKTDPYIPVYIILPFLIGICIAIAVYFGLRRKKKDSANINEKKMPNGIIEEQEQQTVMLLSRSPTVSKKYTPIPVPSLEHEVRKRSADEGKLFREEFNSLPTGIPEACCEAANREENKVKNRYPNILPGDNSRVTLTSVDGVAGSDYINASYVDGYKLKNKFIAAQGPKQETVSDFWRMIWEQKSATIVMLTNLKEKKEEKCFKYWPDQGLWTYGTIRVSVEDVTVLVDYTIRKFSIQNLQQTGGPKAPRFITQLHFTSWPDFGVPFAPVGMLKFLKKVKTVNPSFSGPIIVHCSAGVGRTGTFIVIDAMIDMMQEEQKVDVFSFVSRIRKQRSHLVQTDIQYSFIYQALLEHFLYGDTELDVSSLEKHIQKLHSKSDNSDITGLEEEFNKLTTVRIRKDHMRTGNKPVNLKKARVLQIIPYDFNRVVLPRKRGQEYSDYVNASYIDGYRQKHYFIATQGPLSITVEDFWKMIWDNKSHTIVMLTELREREQEKCFQYWPSENTVTFENYTIELKTDNLSDAFSVRDFLLTNISEGRKNRLIRQFHFHDWPEIGIPAEGRGMIDLIAAVQKQQQQTGNQPIIVHCSAGAGRTGTFIALSNILERVKAEGLLDVFQTVKSLRMQRPHMVQTVEQYDFCYKVVQDYLDIHSDYANFK